MSIFIFNNLHINDLLKYSNIVKNWRENTDNVLYFKFKNRLIHYNIMSDKSFKLVDWSKLCLYMYKHLKYEINIVC